MTKIDKVEQGLEFARKLKQFHPDDGGVAWSNNEHTIVALADEIERLRKAAETPVFTEIVRKQIAKNTKGKNGKLTQRARKDIAQAINDMQAARDLWTDASHFGLPEEQVKLREVAFSEKRRALNDLLDKHSEP